jgi:hypothetical protein
MRKLSIAVMVLGLVAGSAFAGEAKNITIYSDVKNANNKAQGAKTTAVQNVHSVNVGHGKAKGVYIDGKVQNVNNKAKGYKARSIQNVGSVNVK